MASNVVDDLVDYEDEEITQPIQTEVKKGKLSCLFSLLI